MRFAESLPILYLLATGRNLNGKRALISNAQKIRIENWKRCALTCRRVLADGLGVAVNRETGRMWITLRISAGRVGDKPLFIHH
jgi:hypothetical protein